jgi:beta-hydroxylase
MIRVEPRPFLRALRQQWRTIRDEAMALAPEDFQSWPDHAAYYGAWRVFPLLLRSWPDGLDPCFEANRRKVPRTAAGLDALGVCSAVISRLEPGCHILSHSDAPDPGVQRAHLGLVCPLGAFLRVGNEIVEWADGDAIMFDGQLEHEAVNKSAHDRLVLLVDVFVGDDPTWTGVLRDDG